MRTELMIQQVLDQMSNRLTGLENEVIQLKNENNQKDEEIEELQTQITNALGPSMIMGNKSFMAMLKAFFEQKESKVHVPEPHNWEGDWEWFNTFQWECETWLTDQKVTNQGKAVTLIAGYMKGLAAQWYTINQKARELAEEPWVSTMDFWKEVEMRFGDANPNFTTRMKLEKLKQGWKSVHTYNSRINEYWGLTSYNEITLINTYYRGLNNDIICKIFNKENVLVDLSGAQWAAINIKNLEQQLKQFTSGQHWKALITKNIMKLLALAIKPTTTTPITWSSPLAGTTGPMDLNQAWKEGFCRHCSE